MISQEQKLEMFVQMGLMEQQFPLVVAGAVEYRQVLETVGKFKKTAGNVFETGEISSLLAQKNGVVVFRVDEKNLAEILDLVHEIRLHGVAKIDGRTFQFPDFLKMVFVVSNDCLRQQKVAVQDKILYTFSPVFRFEV